MFLLVQYSLVNSSKFLPDGICFSLPSGRLPKPKPARRDWSLYRVVSWKYQTLRLAKARSKRFSAEKYNHQFMQL